MKKTLSVLVAAAAFVALAGPAWACETDEVVQTTSTTVPPTTTAAPTTTVAKTDRVIDAPVVKRTATRAVFSYDCPTRSASVQFVNDGNLDDRVTVAGHEVAVPANGFARINLDQLGDNRFTFGPVSSFVTNSPISVQGAPLHDGTGAVTTPCTYIDTAVESKVVAQPTELAFTGARTNIMAGAAAVLIFFGAMSLGLSHRVRKLG